MSASSDLSKFSPRVFLAFGSLLSRACRFWFRYRMNGLERIPSTPCMFVGNHSGLGVADVLCMLGAFRRQFGLDRRVVGMMHDVFVALPVIGPLMQACGAVRADPENARATIARAYDLAVFPGGDIDSCRPFTAGREVRFGPRRGYVRLALERALPIVPVVTHGSHYTYLVVPGGEAVARLLRARRWSRNTTWPVTVGSVAFVMTALAVLTLGVSAWWLLAAAIAMLVPTPVRITTRVLAPIDVAAATAHIADPAERVEAAHRMVHGAIARTLASMQHDVRPRDAPRMTSPRCTIIAGRAAADRR